MGWQVPRRLVSAGDALPHRAHEEDRPVTARASRTDPQLFPRSEAALQRGCRGPEQQSQTHNEKILRIPHLPLSRTRPLSLTWQITGAGIYPRFFLTNLKKGLKPPFEPSRGFPIRLCSLRELGSDAPNQTAAQVLAPGWAVSDVTDRSGHWPSSIEPGVIRHCTNPLRGNRLTPPSHHTRS